MKSEIRRLLPPLCMLVLAVQFPPNVRSGSLDAVTETARSDLKSALDELTSLKLQVESERIALGTKLTDLEKTVHEERNTLQRLQREEANQMVLLNLLRSEVNALSNDVRAVESIVSEYRRNFEARINIAERQQYTQAIQNATAAAESPDLSPVEKLGRQLDFVAVSLNRIEESLGGRRFEGEALGPNGVMEHGTFLIMGPAAYFASSQSETTGFVEQKLNSPDANVAALEGYRLKDLINQGTGDLPFDPTMGNALRVRAVRDPLGTHIKKGGPVMVPILLLGGAGIVLFVVKWIELSRIRIATPMDLKMILASLETGHRRKAAEYTNRIAGPVGEMLDLAIAHYGEPKEHVEEVMYERMLAAKPRLERYVPFLSLAAATAPLLGLLGTVTGMINTFNLITVFGTGDPKTLASGISEALITTEFGLIIAVPSLLLHALLSRKVRAVLASMEQTAVAFINGLPEQASEEFGTYRRSNEND
ncbi:MAG: MotA/TolQ/ExbB proton channel family protein [Verrucomicrobiae bacterium]|nr:MotA/TolQ/ExbB proton channel family protein [Verrucomicrobiae bacterium]